MTRASFASIVLVCLSATVMGGRQRPTFQAASDTVVIHATVVDERGRVVTDLGPDDFEVLDEGRVRTLTAFDNGVQPITIVVMLDRSGSVRPHAELIRAGARAFVSNLFAADRARIGTFSDSIRVDPAEFTGDHDELLDILDRELLPRGGTPLWNATAMALDALSAEPGRRVVLVFTDGRDTPGLGVNTSFDELRRRVQQEETMLYAIGLSDECAEETTTGSGASAGATSGAAFQIGGRGPILGPRMPLPPSSGPHPPFPGRVLPPRLPEPAPERWTPPPVIACREQGPDPDLRELAAVGGGGYFELRSTDDLAATFSRVALELHSQYLVAFSAPEHDGRLHALTVRVKRPNVTVRARKAYQAPGGR